MQYNSKICSNEPKNVKICKIKCTTYGFLTWRTVFMSDSDIFLIINNEKKKKKYANDRCPGNPTDKTTSLLLYFFFLAV